MLPLRTISHASRKFSNGNVIPMTPDTPIVGLIAAVPEMTDETNILKLIHNFNFEEDGKPIEDISLMLAASLSATNDPDTIFYYQIYNPKKERMVCSLKNKYENNFSKKNLSFLCKKGTMSEYSSNNIFIVRTSEFAVYALFSGHGPFGHYPSFYCQLRFSMVILVPASAVV